MCMSGPILILSFLLPLRIFSLDIKTVRKKKAVHNIFFLCTQFQLEKESEVVKEKACLRAGVLYKNVYAHSV